MAADWLLSVRGCSAGQLRQEIYRMGRFVGKKTALACVDHATGASESAYESLFRAGLIQRKVTGWRFQVTLGRYRPDFLFDDFLIVEIDGRSKYADNTREVLMRERDRERALTNMGYVVLRLYPEDLHDMDRVVAEITRARKARKAPPKGRPEGPSGSA